MEMAMRRYEDSGEKMTSKTFSPLQPSSILDASRHQQDLQRIRRMLAPVGSSDVSITETSELVKGNVDETTVTPSSEVLRQAEEATAKKSEDLSPAGSPTEAQAKNDISTPSQQAHERIPSSPSTLSPNVVNSTVKVLSRKGLPRGRGRLSTARRKVFK